MNSASGTSKISLPAASIFEVGPRDGLQNEKTILSLEQRTELIAKLIASGLRDIEVGSFVRDDKIPALAGTGRVLQMLRDRKIPAASSCRFWAFVPNQKGFEDALSAGIEGAALFVAASDTFCHKNVNRSLVEQKKEVQKLIALASAQKMPTRIYLSTLVYCPYEGVVKPEQVSTLARELLDMGATKVVLSDTTGHADPLSLARVFDSCAPFAGPEKFALHLHDTRGLALVNAMEGLRWGISQFDASVAGLGGCPYAPGASGNLATEDLAYMLSQLKILGGGFSLAALAEAGHFVEKALGKKGPSKMLRTFQEATR